MLILYIEYFRLVTGNFLSRSYFVLVNVTLATTINLYFPCNLSTINKFEQKPIILRLELEAGGQSLALMSYYCHLSTASNFSGEKAKCALIFPLPTRCTLIMNGAVSLCF
jgi:hypothetical protein